MTKVGSIVAVSFVIVGSNHGRKAALEINHRRVLRRSCYRGQQDR